MKPCDCLNYCGDDPRLQEGLAQPCTSAAEKAEKRKRSMERDRLEKALAARWALDVVRSAGEQVLVNGHIHFKTQLPARHPAAADLAHAARYLQLADLATPHPTRAHVLRITEA